METLSLVRRPSLQDPLQLSLLSKKVSLPPKQIITKEYSPDTKPQMKLITKQQLDKSSKNITYIPPKVKNQQFQKYGQKFHVTDFLGYNYAEEFDQMVYFRYNNEQYNELHQNNSDKGTKFLAGLFIPLRALLSKQFKAQNNIYEALNIFTPQINDSITQSFSKNCKGCSLDPLFSSNYVSGNLMAAIRKKPFQYDLILQNDTNSKTAQWFNFAVKFTQEGTYNFNITNLSTDSPFFEMGMKIPFYSFFQQSLKIDSSQVIKSGNGWSFGGKNIRLIKSDLRKQNQMLDNTYYSLSFQFKCRNRHQIIVFSSSIPYTGLDYERFLNRVLFSKIGQHMKMEKIQLCQTLGGSTLSAYVFYHRKSKSHTMFLKNKAQQNLQNSRSNQKHKTLNLNISLSNANLNGSITQNSTLNITKSIVFLARQHSGQTCSSFILEGIIEFLMDNTQFDVFKKNFQFIIIPFLNADGVKYGNQKVNLAGADLNKVWKNPNQSFQPQVFYVKKFLKSVHQIHPISLLINLQSNSHSLSSYFTSCSSRKQNQEPLQLFPYICSKRIQQVSFQKSQFSCSKPLSLIYSLSELFSKSLIYSFSVSTYGWKTQSTAFRRYTQSSVTQEQQSMISQFTPQIYRNVGRQLISTYLQYVRLCQKNIGIRDRWLKQIQSLSQTLKTLTKQQNFYEKKYQQTWDRQLIRFDYSLFLPPAQFIKTDVRKHKTALFYRASGNLMNEVRSKSKKLTMPNVRNGRYSKQEKQNSYKTSQLLKRPSQNLTIANTNDVSVESILNQFKKSPLSSSIFTPKRRTQILREISQSIKQSSNEKQSTFNQGFPSMNLQTIVEKKQKEKKLSRLRLNGKTSQLVQKQRLQIIQQRKSQNDSKNKKTNLKDAIVKFQNMKKFISAMGIKSEVGNNKIGNA